MLCIYSMYISFVNTVCISYVYVYSTHIVYTYIYIYSYHNYTGIYVNKMYTLHIESKLHGGFQK